MKEKKARGTKYIGEIEKVTRNSQEKEHIQKRAEREQRKYLKK